MHCVFHGIRLLRLMKVDCRETVNFSLRADIFIMPALNYYRFQVSSFRFQVSGLTSSIIPRTPSSDYAFPQGLLLHVITSRFGLIQVSGCRDALRMAILNSQLSTLNLIIPSPNWGRLGGGPTSSSYTHTPHRFLPTLENPESGLRYQRYQY